MLIPDKLKLNRFRAVALPSNQDLYRRFGLSSGSVPSSQFSGDEEANFHQTKIDQIAEADALNRDYLGDEERMD